MEFGCLRSWEAGKVGVLGMFEFGKVGVWKCWDLGSWGFGELGVWESWGLVRSGFGELGVREVGVGEVGVGGVWGLGIWGFGNVGVRQVWGLGSLGSQWVIDLQGGSAALAQRPRPPDSALPRFFAANLQDLQRAFKGASSAAVQQTSAEERIPLLVIPCTSHPCVVPIHMPLHHLPFPLVPFLLPEPRSLHTTR